METENQTNMLYWSPMSVLTRTIYPSDAEYEEVKKYFADLDNSLPWTQRNIGNGQILFEINGRENYTGDVHNNYLLQHDKRFSFLFLEIKSLVLDYLREYGVLKEDMHDVHIMKAWPVILKNNGSIQLHTHLGSHISVVYYPNDSDDADGAGLEFIDMSSLKLTIPMLPDFQQDRTFISSEMMVVKSSKNQLVVFPSQLSHRVTKKHSTSSRYSLSFDVFITLKNIDVANSGEVLIHPSKWVCL